MATDDLIKQWIRPAIRALSAYHVADASGLIKLDAMENPYQWPQGLVQEWLACLQTAELNRYPDPDAAVLTQQLRTSMQVPAGMGVLLGNGSDEIIQMLALAVAEPGRVILAPEPTFVMYRMIAAFTDMQFEGVALNDDFGLDMDAMLAAIQQHQPALVFLAFPNNPSGNLFDAQQVRDIIQACPGLVIVDEAYHAFCGDSFMPVLGEYPNLLVMRTLSKMGLAGLRLGLLAGAPAWIEQINKVRLPYNINVLTQLSAAFALKHQAVMEEQTQAICSAREQLLSDMRALSGITVYPSCANFILFRTALKHAGDVFNALKSRGVLIKNMDGSHAQMKDCLRVTVGTPEQNQAFMAALATVIK